MAVQLIAVGQSSIPDVTVRQGKYTFGIRLKGSELERSANTIIKQIALHLTKALDKTHYSVDYSLNLFPGRSDNNLGIKVNVIKISGDTTLNGFNISNALMPQLVSFNIKFIDNNGNIPDSATFSNIKTGQDTILIFPFPANYKFSAQNENIELSRIVFGYDKSGFEKCKLLFKAINTYKAATMLAEFVERRADTLNRQALTPSPEMLLQLDELSRAVSLLAQLQNQWDSVGCSSDPDLLKGRQRILAYRVHYIQQLYLSKAVTKAASPSRQDICTLAKNYVTMQAAWLTDATKPDFANIVFYQLGEVYYQPADLKFLQKATLLMLQSARQEALPVGCAAAIYDAVIEAYIKEGEKLASSGYYAEAVALMGSAARLCEKIPMVNCPDRVYQLQATALYGTYHSYIHIAQKALALNKPALANYYTDAAENLQRTYSRFIITDIAVKQLYKQVAAAWYHSGNEKQKSLGHDAAKADLQKAEIASIAANEEPLGGSVFPKLEQLHNEMNSNKAVRNNKCILFEEEDYWP